MVNVKIDPAFGDERMEGEYDDGRYQQAEEHLIGAIVGFVRAGGRCENLEAAIETALSERLEIG